MKTKKTNMDPHTVEYWKSIANEQSKKLHEETKRHYRTSENLEYSRKELEHADEVRRGANIALVFLFLLVALEWLAILAICADRILLR